MELVHDIGIWLEFAAAIVLSIAAVTGLWRRSSRPTIWLSAAILCAFAGACGLILLSMTPHDVADVTLGGTIANTAFVLVPFLLFGFGREYHPPSKRVDYAVIGLAVALVAAFVSIPLLALSFEPTETWHHVSQATMGAVSLALIVTVAVRLWVDGGRIGSVVARARMRLLSAAVFGAAFGYVLTAIPHPIPAALLGYVVAASAFVGVISFRPPRWLRSAWRGDAVPQLEAMVTHLMAARRPTQVTDESLPLLVDLLGARRASIVLTDGTMLAACEGDHGEVPIRGIGDIVHLPIAQGELIIETDVYTPVFGDEEHGMMSLVASYLSLAIERCESVAQQERASAHLERVDRMKDAFMAAASHDLRSPVATLVGSSRLLRDSHDELPAAQRSELLDELVVSGERVGRMLDDMLDLGRFTTGHVAVNLVDMDVRAIADRAVTSPRLGSVRVSVHGERTMTRCDPVLLERALENLLVNAMRHAGPEPLISLGVGIDDDRVRIDVDDDGPGVPVESRERIFEPLVRGEPFVAGHGLGLSIVARFVELQAGRTWVEDSPLGGARFSIALPIASS